MINERQTKDICKLVRFDGVIFFFYSRLISFQILHELKQTQKINRGNSNLELFGKVYSFTCYIEKKSAKDSISPTFTIVNFLFIL